VARLFGDVRVLLDNRETVFVETPACRATSCNVLGTRTTLRLDTVVIL
jgi:hypothetical protein